MSLIRSAYDVYDPSWLESALMMPSPLNGQLVTYKEKRMNGTKPIVICSGTTTEAKDLNDAQAIAERLAHQHQADAFILKPVKKVAPKRDVVTTDLE